MKALSRGKVCTQFARCAAADILAPRSFDMAEWSHQGSLYESEAFPASWRCPSGGIRSLAHRTCNEWSRPSNRARGRADGAGVRALSILNGPAPGGIRSSPYNQRATLLVSLDEEILTTPLPAAEVMSDGVDRCRSISVGVSQCPCGNIPVIRRCRPYLKCSGLTSAPYDGWSGMPSCRIRVSLSRASRTGECRYHGGREG